MPLPTLLATLAGVAAVLFAALWFRGRRSIARIEDEVRQLQRVAQRGDEARDAFFDLVTHELRSPLSAILGYQELMADGAYGQLGDAPAEPIERIGRSARHLLHLIDGVVELSRLSSQTVQLDLGPVDLGGLLASVADAFRTLARERRLEPVVRMPASLPTIRSDQDRLVRALDLAITSGVKYTDGPEIRLEVEPAGERVRLRITPTAFTVRDDHTDPALRYGIRLAVARSLARLMGGDLELDTDVDGVIRALTFTIRDHRVEDRHGF